MLAWLWLRGRCRDCRQPISFRYPLVEAVTAGLFLLLLVVEVFHGGQNLPVRIPPAAGPHPYPPAQALGICLLHLGLLCTLMAAGLIRWDGKRPPRWLFVPLLLVGLVAPPIWPWLHPLPAGPGVAESPWGGVVDSLLGLGTGLFLGRIAEWLGKRFAVMGKPGSQILGEALVIGVVLGWQAVLVLVPLAMLLEELSRIAALRWTSARRFVAAVWIAPLTLLWILNWARLAAWLQSSSLIAAGIADRRHRECAERASACHDCWTVPCHLHPENTSRDSAQRSARQPEQDHPVAQLSIGLRGHRFPEQPPAAGGADGTGVPQAGIHAGRPRHREHDRGFRQHADRRTGRGPSPPGGGPAAVGPNSPAMPCVNGPWPRPSGSWPRAATTTSPASSPGWCRRTATPRASPTSP